MSNRHIKIVGDDLLFDGLKVGTLLPSGIPSTDAAVRLFLTKLLSGSEVREWRP